MSEIFAAPIQAANVWRDNYGALYDAAKATRKTLTSTIPSLPGSISVFLRRQRPLEHTDAHDNDGNTVVSGGIKAVTHDFENRKCSRTER